MVNGNGLRKNAPVIAIVFTVMINVATIVWGAATIKADVHDLQGHTARMAFVVDDLLTRVTTIEANRFTAQDGMRIWQELERRPIRDEIPPDWFRDQVNSIDQRLQQLEREIRGRP